MIERKSIEQAHSHLRRRGQRRWNGPMFDLLAVLFFALAGTALFTLLMLGWRVS